MRGLASLRGAAGLDVRPDRVNRFSFEAWGPHWPILLLLLSLPLVSREWKNGSNSSYNCTPFLHSLLTKGRLGPVGISG